MEGDRDEVVAGGINIPCCRHYGHEYVNPLCDDGETT